MPVDEIVAKLESYMAVPAVVGFEDHFMALLADDFNFPGYTIEEHDGIIAVTKTGTKSPVVITAHTDRHGIVVNEEGEFEYAAFYAKRNYGIPIESPESVFQKSADRYIGEAVFAYDSGGNVIWDGEVIDSSYDFDAKKVVFGIGGLGGLPSDTPIALRSVLSQEDDLVSSQIDNAASIAVARQLVANGFDGTVLLAVEEEIANSWTHIVKYLAGHAQPTREIIVLDTTPYDDERAIRNGLVVLRNRDAHGIFNPSLVHNLRKFCESNDILYEMKDEFLMTKHSYLPDEERIKKLGKTELGRIVNHTDGEYNGATVQLPTTGYHTNHETTSRLALGNFYKALEKLLI
ncbi:MAG: hypothetical protein ACE5FT_05605 [Candidatus Nanoarchaeia archaeon]